MKTPFLLLLSVIFFLSACTESPKNKEAATSNAPDLKEGPWRVALDLGPKSLPFNLQLSDLDSNSPQAIITNDGEELEITDVQLNGDSLILNLPYFQSVLKAKIESDILMSGVWKNNNKKAYAVPFMAEHGKNYRFTPSRSSLEIKESYHVVFEPGTDGAYNAVLKLENDRGRLSGTFLTETGDYRYLEGNIMNRGIYLSTFDGSHAFRFSADFKGDSLVNGSFLSGTHYAAKWIASPDTSFELRDPEKLTFIENDAEQIDFSLPNQDGDTVSWADMDLDGKVVIIDIMGSWCPNCMDAGKALKELTEPYNQDEVQIITVAFELTQDFNTARKRIFKMQEDIGLSKRFLFAGFADKENAWATFPMLNHVMSYPTLIFIDKNREVRKIYTGFYGPGTGDYYKEFMAETGKLLDQMVQ